MGVYAKKFFDKLTIPPQKIDKCLERINNLYTDEKALLASSGGSVTFDKKDGTYKRIPWFAGVHEPTDTPGHKTIEEALDSWSFSFYVPDNGCIVITGMLDEKVGDEEIFFGAIAPCVLPGGSVIFDDENDEIWKYCFDGASFTKQPGTRTMSGRYRFY
jgi:hypothetical protein